MNSKEYDLIIVGAGMVGLSLAAAMSKITGLRIALLDERPSTPCGGRWPERPEGGYINQRFSAINSSSEQFLKDLGVWQRILEYGASPYRRMIVWDATGQGEVVFNSQDTGCSHLGHIISNQAMQSALYEQIQLKSNLELIFSASPQALLEQTNSVVLVLQDGRELSAKLLAGADGGHSWVRRQAGIPVRQWPYGQYALTATVSTSVPHEHTAWQRFLPSGPLAFLPLNNPIHCSIVWSTSEQQAQDLLSMGEDEFNGSLTKAFDGRLGEVQVIGKRAIFPLNMSHVKQYIKPRLAVLGDAAHTLHPLAGQGANLGFSDAKNLAEVILAATQAQGDIGEFSLLRRYERARKADNWEMIAIVEGFKRLFSNDSVSLSMLRNFGLNLVNKHSLIKRMIMRRAMGI